MFDLLKKLKSQSGSLMIAKDEAILIGGMVASMTAFVGMNVSWDSLFGAPANLVDDLITIEMANTEFYARHKIWPHQTTNGDWGKNVSALVTPEAMRYPYNDLTSFRNLLDGFAIQPKTYNVQHNYGGGGDIQMHPITYNNERYLEIIFKNVPLKEAHEVDQRVDGEFDPEFGRVKIIYSNENSKVASVHYRANQI